MKRLKEGLEIIGRVILLACVYVNTDYLLSLEPMGELDFFLYRVLKIILTLWAGLPLFFYKEK